jgi:tetratricopeptide (TPR) repeat protein
VKSHFAQLIHPEKLELDSAKRSLRYWTNEGVLPDEQDKDKVDRIYRELFGDDPHLQEWKADLERALEQGRRQQAARIARREIPQAHGVPRPTAHFMGRSEEVNSLADTLAASDGDAAILVQGGPGIGKTELTKAIAHHDDVADRFGERRYFVPLETANSAASMRDAIARSLGCDPRHGLETALQGQGGADTLLILDNLETPWEPAGERSATERTLAELASVPGLALLASFRGREAVGGTRWLEHALAVLPSGSAIQLLASVAGKWVFDDPDLDQLINALGGVPLAIDLVARRAHGRASLATLGREWTKVGADLAVLPEFTAHRLTSLPHSIELTLRSRRITKPAMRLFSLLGVLPAGLATEDIETLIGEAAFEAAERLCHVGIATERAGRIDLLPPVRDHARRRYRPHGRDAAQWVTHFLIMTKQLGVGIGTSAGECAVHRLRREFRNVEAAFRAAIERGELSETMEALEGIDRFTSLTTVSTSVFEELAEFCRGNSDLANEAYCMRIAGNVAFRRAEYGDATARYGRALEIYRMAGETSGQAYCLRALGETALYSSHYEPALIAFDQALQLFRLSGDVLGEAHCYRGVGDIAFRRSDHDTARSAHEHALHLYKEVGDLSGETQCMFRAGEIALAQCDLDAAELAYEQALPLYRKIGDTLGEANCIRCLAQVALERDDFDAARSAYETALQIYRKIGAVLGEANCIKGYGNIAFNLSDYDAARTAFEEALRLYIRTRSLLGEANCWDWLGDISFAESDYDAAKSAYEKALPLYRRYGDIVGEANSTTSLGDVARARSDYEAAGAAYDEALHLYRKVGLIEHAEDCRRKLESVRTD